MDRHPTGFAAVSRAADTDISMGKSQPAVHVLSRPSLAASTSRPGSGASGSVVASQSPLPRPPSTSSRSAEVMPPPPAPEEGNGLSRAVDMAGGSSHTKAIPSDNPEDAGGALTDASSELSSAPSSEPDSNRLPIRRIIGATKPKRGPSALQGPRRVTRSSSMKVQGVKGEGAKIGDTSDMAKSKEHMCCLWILISSAYGVCQCLLRSQLLPQEHRQTQQPCHHRQL